MSDTRQDTASRQRRQVRWYYQRDRLLHFRRWWQERCAACGHRPFWTESMISMPGTGVFHDACHAAQHWRRVASERLDVLAVVVDVWDVNPSTVREVMETREGDGPALPRTSQGAKAWDKAWRVFYDLEKREEVNRARA